MTRLRDPADRRSRQRSAQPARSALQAETTSIHEALHDAPPFAAIAEQRLRSSDYTRLLSALFAYHSSLQFIVAAGCRRLELQALLNACELRRHRLAVDLATLNAQLPPVGKSVAAVDDAWAVGCLYTLVGSSLGGKVIFRQLDYLLPTPAGRTFFAGTAGDGERWREFCNRLEAFGTEQQSLTPLIEGAHFAFEHFASCLERHR
ncbi:biliverdin-producing heme oxygenase [uncultured Sphingomonas sp.]|uniref:biliverdin-producing heme oxygenase n=1 Tax=uncultured Sphingomonas sp. TaxID=158754 RepID=UPI0025D51614|nr:biliverdin-producing heme oxygenase [uncultured Sphingomonas sp.]